MGRGPRFLIAPLALFVCLTAHPALGQTLRILQIDTGQADAALLVSPGGNTLVAAVFKMASEANVLVGRETGLAQEDAEVVLSRPRAARHADLAVSGPPGQPRKGRGRDQGEAAAGRGVQQGEVGDPGQPLEQLRAGRGQGDTLRAQASERGQVQPHAPQTITPRGPGPKAPGRRFIQ